MITGPCGVLGCFAMKSGTSLWAGRVKSLMKKTGKSEEECQDNFKFWYDYITELLTAKDLEHLFAEGDTIDLQQIRDELASREWLVRATNMILEARKTMLR